MLKWFFSEGLFKYLKTTTIWKKFLDLLFIVSVATWVSVAYLVATNFTTITAMLSRSEKIEVASAVQMNTQIDTELRYVLTATGADRVGLARFHNGRTDTQGIHFIYASRSNEVDAPGVASALGQRQSMLLSIINSWMVKFLKGECVYSTGNKPGDQFYEFFREVGVKSSISCPVIGNTGDLIAFISVEYTTRNLSPEQMKAKESAIRAAALRFGGMLSLRAQ